MDLDLEFLTQVNKVYLTKFRSLQKTCNWLRQEHGIKINRLKLSDLFHANDLRVLLPNGGHVTHRKATDEWASPANELAGRFVQDIFSDIRGYRDREGVSRIDFLSACAAFSGQLYESFLDTLQSTSGLRVNNSTLPSDIPSQLVLEGRDIYLRNALLWVDT